MGPGLLWQRLAMENQSCLYTWLSVGTAAGQGVGRGLFGTQLAAHPRPAQLEASPSLLHTPRIDTLELGAEEVSFLEASLEALRRRLEFR